MQTHTLLSKLLKEPLFHFLLIGFGLFFLFTQMHKDKTEKPKIIITEGTIKALAQKYQESNGTEASKEEMQTLLDKDIREEVLYHEAMVMGLDKGDKVIRHRLAEKMSYLFEDVSMLEDPSEEVLKEFFKNNKQNFKHLSSYQENKEEITQAWILSEQAKENKVFYESLKNRYHIIIEETE